jgi:hypothetical protein
MTKWVLIHGVILHNNNRLTYFSLTYSNAEFNSNEIIRNEINSSTSIVTAVLYGDGPDI